MKISVFTPSFNKTQFVEDAIKSVLNQTYKDFEYWILENSTNPETRNVVKQYINDPRIRYVERDFPIEQRRTEYVTTILLNEYYQKANGEYIFYLSDDDYFKPECFQKCMEHVGSHPDQSVWYFSVETVRQVDNGWEPVGSMIANHRRGLGTGLGLDCAVDGGQVFHRKSVLGVLDKPYFETTFHNATASHCDGLFLDKIGEKFSFEPINIPLLVHRRTRLSTFVIA